MTAECDLFAGTYSLSRRLPYCRVLEMQSSGRRKELRFQYRQAETVFSETFAVDVADDSWHKIALTLSDTRLDLYIDCVHRYTRTILPLDRQTLRGAKNLTLWLGQRGRHHFAYQVRSNCYC